MRVLSFLVMLFFVPAELLAKETARWIEAEGLAVIHSQQDHDAARRRALGEALISAALAGGADLQGHSTLHNARLVSDVAVLRATGRVLRHETLSATVDRGHWRVRIRALVGPSQPLECRGKRHLVVDATPPRINIAPTSGVWATPVAQRLARNLYAEIGKHPKVTLESVAPRPTRRVAATLDYTTLTRGEIKRTFGNQTLDVTITVRGQGPKASLTLEVTVIEPSGSGTSKVFEREATARQNGLTALATGQRRPQAEQRLVKGLARGVSDFLHALSCRHPTARIAQNGGTLSVPMGRRQGLTRASLAFIDDPRNSFGLLEIVKLSDRRATLRPLDPTRSAASFTGQQVYFVETGR